MAKQRVTFIVDEDLYAEFKIALLKRTPRRNVSQELIAHIKSVVANEENPVSYEDTTEIFYPNCKKDEIEESLYGRNPD